MDSAAFWSQGWMLEPTPSHSSHARGGNIVLLRVEITLLYSS
jgi:hypothetical protein